MAYSKNDLRQLRQQALAKRDRDREEEHSSLSDVNAKNKWENADSSSGDLSNLKSELHRLRKDVKSGNASLGGLNNYQEYKNNTITDTSYLNDNLSTYDTKTGRKIKKELNNDYETKKNAYLDNVYNNAYSTVDQSEWNKLTQEQKDAIYGYKYMGNENALEYAGLNVKAAQPGEDPSRYLNDLKAEADRLWQTSDDYAENVGDKAKRQYSPIYDNQVLVDKYGEDVVEKGYAIAKEIVDSEYEAEKAKDAMTEGVPYNVAPAYTSNKKEKADRKEAYKQLKELGIKDVDLDRFFDKGRSESWAERRAEKEAEMAEKVSTPLGAARETTNKILSSPYNNAANFVNTIQYTKEGRLPDFNDPVFEASQLYDYAQQNIGEKIQNSTDTIWGDVGKFAYDAAVTTGEAISGMTQLGAVAESLGVGGAAAEVIGKILIDSNFAMGSYASTLEEAENRGLSFKQAQATAIVAGLAEAATEEVGLEYLYDVYKKEGAAAARNAIVNFLVSGGLEGSEEAASDIINQVADRIINGELSKYSVSVDEYVEQGYSIIEARQMADKDFLKEVGKDTAMGAISGLAMGSVATAGQKIGYNAQGIEYIANADDARTISANISDNAADYKNSEKYNYAQKTKKKAEDVAAKLEAGEKVSDSEKGKLIERANYVVNDIAETKSGQEFLKERSATMDIEDISREIHKYDDLTDNSIFEDMEKAIYKNGNSANEVSKKANLAKFIEAYHTSEMAEGINKQLIDTTYGAMKSDLIRSGMSAERIEMAEKAYDMGKNAEMPTAEINGNAELKEIYNLGADAYRWNSYVKPSDINPTVTVDGKELEVKAFEGGKVKLSDGSFTALDNVKFASEKAQQIFLEASKYDEALGNAFVEGLKNSSVSLAMYKNTFDTVVALASNGASYEHILNKVGTAVRTGVIAKQDLRGIVAATQKGEERRAKAHEGEVKTKTGKKGEGKVSFRGDIEEQTRASMGDSTIKMLENLAKYLHTDIVFEESDVKNMRGKFDASLGQIVINTATASQTQGKALIHEIVEFIDHYSPEKMQSIYDTLFNFMLKNDEIKFSKKVKGIQKLYEDTFAKSNGKAGELNKTFRDAASEMFNDMIAEIFSEGDNIEVLARFAVDEYGVEEGSKRMHTIADFFDDAITWIKNKLKGEGSKYSREVAMLDKGTKAKIVTDILNALDEAVKVADTMELSDGKAIDKENGVVKTGTKFALENPYEETDVGLIADSAMSEENLIQTIELGGFPMPSIAVMKAKNATGNNQFGKLTVVFSKDTIDPREKTNKVYSGDAWTPTFPSIASLVDEKKQKAISKKIYDLIGEDAFYALRAVLDYDNMQDKINRSNGDVVNAYAYDSALKYAYLLDKGIDYKIPERSKKYGNNEAEELFNLIEQLNSHDFNWEEANQSSSYTMEWVDSIRNILNAWWKAHYNVDEMYDDKHFGFANVDRLLRYAREYKRDLDKYGKIPSEVDYFEARKELDEKVKTDDDDYNEWLKDLFSGIVSKKGIRNNKDMFTSSGNRRSWNALHDEITLENVVKAMRNEALQKGIGALGMGQPIAAATYEFSSIEDVKAHSNQLQQLSEEEYDAIRNEFTARFSEIAKSFVREGNTNFGATIDAGEALCEYMAKSKTKSGLKSKMKADAAYFNYTEDIADDLWELVQDIQKMPANYFEAKPQRAVGLDEIAYVVVPSDASNELITMLDDNGIAHVEYEAGNDESRLEALNSRPEVQFSLEDTDGNNLTEDQATFFEDSKVRDDKGRLMVMYHGTPKMGFTVFDIKMARSSGLKGRGFYFSPEKSVSAIYGDAYKVYLNLVNPITPGTNAITEDQIRALVERLAEDEDYGIENYGYGATIDDVVDSVMGKDDYSMLMDLNLACVGDFVQTIKLFNEENGTNYDGIIDAAETVAFYPNQIKNVTNEHPTENPDIRYALELITDHYDGGNVPEGFRNACCDEEIILDYHELEVARSAIINRQSKRYKKETYMFSDVAKTSNYAYLFNSYSYEHFDTQMIYKIEGNEYLERTIIGAGSIAIWDEAAKLVRGNDAVDNGSNENGRSDNGDDKVFGSSRASRSNGVVSEDNGDSRTSGNKGSFTPKRIEKILDTYGSSRRGYAEAYIATISPSEYLKLIKDVPNVKEVSPLDVEKLKKANTPMLKIAQDGKVLGYDGKKRVVALRNEGIASMPVLLVEEEDLYGKHMMAKYNLASQKGEESVTATRLIPTDVAYRQDLLEEYGRPSDVQFSLEDTSQISDDNWDDSISAASILKSAAKSLNGKPVNEKFIKGIAAKYIKETGSKYGVKNLTENLTKVFNELQSNENVNYDDLERIIAEVAKPVIEEATTEVAEEREAYDNFVSAIRSHKLTLSDNQKEGIESVYGTVGKFQNEMRRHSMLYFAKEGGMQLDQVWPTLVEASGYVLDEDVSDQDMPMALLEALNTLKPSFYNEYGENADEAARDLGMQMVSDYFRVNSELAAAKGIKDFADEMRADIQRKMQSRYEAELTKMYNKGYNDNAKYTNEKIAELKARQKNNLAEVRDKNTRTDVMNSIKRTSGRLFTMALNPTDKKHIPDGLKEPVVMFLNSIDFIPKMGKDNKVTKVAYAWREKTQALESLIGRMLEGKAEDETLNAMGKRIDPDLADMMIAFIDANKTKAHLSEIDTEQLKALNKILTAITHQIGSVNETLANERYSDNAELAYNSIKEMNERKERIDKNGLQKFVRDFLTLNLDAESVFETFGESSKSVLAELREGFNQKVRRVRESQNDFARLVADSGVDPSDLKNWSDKKDIKTFNFAEGELKLTTAQIISLYNHMKREQSRKHILEGGVKAGNVKGKYGERSKPIHLTEENIKEITDTLTSEQKKLAENMQRYLSDTVAGWGNNAARKAYGYTKFDEKYYWPIRVDSNSVSASDKSLEQASLYKVRNMSSAKALAPGANNAMFLDDAFEVFANHVAEMATYEGMMLPLTDAMTWYNYMSTDDMTGTRYDVSVKEAIERIMGKKGQEWFLQQMKDLNGDSNGRTGLELMSKMASNYKAAAIAFNSRVVIQQPTAIVRAANEMDPKYLTQAMGSTLKAGQYAQKAQQNSALAQWKSWGYFDSMIGQSMKQVITGQSTVKDKVQDAAAWAAQKADDLTWGILYRAAELEVMDTTNLEYDSKEFTDAVVKRFEEVVNRTQVVDNPLNRTMLMRDKRFDMLTAFKMEPAKSYNMIYRAVISGDKKKLARALVTYLANAITVSAAAAFIDAFRADDDDKKFWVRYLEALLGVKITEDGWEVKAMDVITSVLGDNINPLNLLPGLAEISSALQGFKPARMDVAFIYDTMDAVNQTIKFAQGKGNKTPYGMLKTLATAVSSLTGLPVKTAMREIETFYNNVGNLFDLENLKATHSTSDYYKVHQAIDSKKATDDKIKSEVQAMLDAGKEKSGISSALTSHYKPIMQKYYSTDKQKAIELKQKLIVAYMAAGYTRDEANDKINSWVK